MASIKANQIRKGMVLLHNGVPHRVLDFHHHTPGNLRAMVQTRMRNLKSGNTMEHRFSSTENVERAHFEEQEMSYLYQEGDTYYFMNNDTYEQIGLHAEELGDDAGYLLPETNVKIEFFEGQPISVTIPGDLDELRRRIHLVARRYSLDRSEPATVQPEESPA